MASRQVTRDYALAKELAKQESYQHIRVEVAEGKSYIPDVRITDSAGRFAPVVMSGTAAHEFLNRTVSLCWCTFLSLDDCFLVMARIYAVPFLTAKRG